MPYPMDIPQKIVDIDTFIALLYVIDPEFVSVAKDRMSLSTMTDMIALDCWLKQRPEDMFSEELRRQINHLNTKGTLDFS